jgi:hypothetical protein
VRTYRLTLKSNQEFELKRNGPVLIVGLDNASKILVNKKAFTSEGDFLFVPSSEKIEITNKGQQDYSFAVLELK